MTRLHLLHELSEGHGLVDPGHCLRQVLHETLEPPGRFVAKFSELVANLYLGVDLHAE